MLIRISETWFCNIFIFITFRLVKKYKHVRIRRTMNGSYVLPSKTTKKTDLYISCQNVKKSQNFSSTCTGREKLIDLSNLITRWILERLLLI